MAFTLSLCFATQNHPKNTPMRLSSAAAWIRKAIDDRADFKSHVKVCAIRLGFGIVLASVFGLS